MRSNLQQKQLLELHQKNTITNDEWQERIDIKTNNQYLLEKIFTADDAKWFTAKCKTCGDEMTKNVHYLRKSALHKKHTCSICSKQKRLAEQNQIKEDKLKQKEEKQIVNWFINTYYNHQTKAKLKHKKYAIINCKHCGKSFTAIYMYSQPSVCFDCKISRRNDNRRIQAILTKPHDDDITLKKLYDRDNGICYLCGGICDWSAKYTDTRGNVIATDNYPSIDHVISLANGGTHQWSNVKLAHRICNSKKQ